MKSVFLLLVLTGFVVAACNSETHRARMPESNPARNNVTQPTGNPPYGCGLYPGSTIGDDGVGDLRVGRAVSAVKVTCDIVSDTIDYNSEGDQERLLTIRAGSDTLIAAVADDTISRVEVTTPRLKTADALGVGDRVSRLSNRAGVYGQELESLIYVSLPTHCGLLFRLSYQLAQRQVHEHWTRGELARLPDTTTINKIEASGCGR